MLEVALQLGLSQEEYERICELLGRTPNFTELSAFAVMWSEHCSYKNSILQLKRLPREGKYVLAKAGEENAGLLTLNEDYAVVFKIESHNHPSAIAPYHGAATGVGGIHRDIFTLGARPIAALNALRFGTLNDPKVQYTVKEVIRGIADYGNAFGVPTVAGDMYFAPCYQNNPLVNAMSVGIVRKDRIVPSKASGVGNKVFLVGAATGKDGIHGATFASDTLDESSHEDLPSVQIGDPFTEKVLLEAVLEAIETDAIIGMQDLGAAGIACATSEMAFKGNCGMRIYLDKVPLRHQNMKPYEILISESQERMLLIVQKGKEEAVKKVFEKWDLPCTEIGEVTEDGWLRYYYKDELVAEIKARNLVVGGDAPQYVRESTAPKYLEAVRSLSQEQIPPLSLEAVAEVLTSLLKVPDIASKAALVRCYDRMVGASTISAIHPYAAAVVKIPELSKALAMSVDCNSRYVYLNPLKGAQLAVCESIRNIACTGAEPLGITNCLNFGNPYNPEIYWQFKQVIEGMRQACLRFQIPVTGGNVSFYNESPDGAVWPTPVIGIVGIIHDLNHLTRMDFQMPDDLIYLLGPVVNDFQGSSYLYYYHRVLYSDAPYCDLEKEWQLYQVLHHCIQQHWVRSAHDVSDGGLLVTLTEMAFYQNLGFEIQTPNSLRLDSFLFGEGGARVVITVPPEFQENIEAFLKTQSLPWRCIGRVLETPEIKINGHRIGNLSTFAQCYFNTLRL